MYSKLDRALVNDKWLDCFELSVATFLPEGSYDHSPILIKLLDYQDDGKKPFRFFNMLWCSAFFGTSSVRVG